MTLLDQRALHDDARRVLDAWTAPDPQQDELDGPTSTTWRPTPTRCREAAIPTT
ncbi:hypothetical protein [Aeromicrobium sp. UC242_57]|uniref:hypothetical protein n=1 Tax=Aeromicrobium sp. UC242_57 TaxID=3374624 RepID=UPI0037B313C9